MRSLLALCLAACGLPGAPGPGPGPKDAPTTPDSATETTPPFTDGTSTLAGAAESTSPTSTTTASA